MQFYPDAETVTRLLVFRMLFLQRLPKDLRMVLVEDVNSTLKELAS